MEKYITIGRLSKMTGVSTRSIRHYENIGLLKCALNTDSNYRLFGENELKKLQQILLLKGLGFSLNEILEIVTAEENVKIARIFESRLKSLEKEVSRIKRSKEMLEAVTRIYKTQPETIREIGEENGHIFLEELHMVIVKALFNGIDCSTEKNIMEMLEVEDPEFAKVAKKAMFTFDDFARLPDDTIKKWADNCVDNELIIALKDSNNYLINKILTNMQSDRAENIKQGIERREFVSLDMSFKAMESLIDILRQMESRGEVVIDRFEY